STTSPASLSLVQLGKQAGGHKKTKKQENARPTGEAEDDAAYRRSGGDGATVGQPSQAPAGIGNCTRGAQDAYPHEECRHELEVAHDTYRLSERRSRQLPDRIG